MCTKNYRVYGWKLKPKVQIEDGFIYIMNLSSRPHFNSVFDLLTVLNFVISGKVTSLHKVIKYVKRSKSSFHEFQRKSATLTITVIHLLTSIDTLKLLIVSVRLHSHTNESICILS